MAVGAADLRVSAQERKAGVGRVIEVPHFPAIRRMALGAVLPETPVVNVVLGVAADAFLGRIIESLCRMALPARDDHVQSRERILRLIVIEAHVLPFRGRVALLALLAQRAAVRLIGAMTVDALRAEFLVLGNARMTHVTVEVRVRAFQGKLEARQVVETGDAPDIVAVTVGTRGSQPAGVLVIGLVAAGAILRYRVLQISTAVAVSAADTRMAAEKGEPGLACMVELLRGPIGRGVAVGALWPLAALVHIVR